MIDRLKKIGAAMALTGASFLAGCGGVCEVDCIGGEEALFPSRETVCAEGSDSTSAPCQTVEPRLTDAQRTAALPMGESQSYTYVVATLDLPPAEDPDGAGPQRAQAVGFNVDGLDSGPGSTAADANCEEFTDDFVSSVDRGLVGVDNGFQDLVGSLEELLDAEDCPGGNTTGCLPAVIQEQINDGSLLLLMTVDNVESLEYDHAVSVRLALGKLPEGSTPTLAGEMLAPDQSFMLDQEIGTPVDGDIFDGRLRVSTDVLTITIDAGDETLPLMIRSAEVRMDLAENGLSNGVIGGVLTIQDLVDTARMLSPGNEGTVESVVSAVADVNPKQDEPAECEAVSIGFAFTGVPATRITSITRGAG